MKIVFEVKVLDDNEKIVSSFSGGSEYSNSGLNKRTFVDSSSLGDGDKAKKRVRSVITAIADTIMEKLIFKGKKD